MKLPVSFFRYWLLWIEQHSPDTTKHLHGHQLTEGRHDPNAISQLRRCRLFDHWKFFGGPFDHMHVFAAAAQIHLPVTPEKFGFVIGQWRLEG
jgi:hypothetical protein